MDIITLCSAVKDSLHYLNGARTSGVLDHKKVVWKRTLSTYSDRLKDKRTGLSKSMQLVQIRFPRSCFPGYPYGAKRIPYSMLQSFIPMLIIKARQLVKNI